MPAGQVIGRVSIKVLPDVTGFKEDAQDKLDKIEKKLEVQIPAVLDITGLKRNILETVRTINEENKSTDSRKIKFFTRVDTTGSLREVQAARRVMQAQADTNQLKFKVDVAAAEARLDLSEDSLKRVKKQIEDWRDKISPIKIQVEPDFSAAGAQVTKARLAVLTRPRTVSIMPKLDEGSLAAVGTALSALSGARMAGDVIEKIWDGLKNLDKAIPSITAVSEGIGGLVGWLGSAVSNTFALGASLSSIIPIALALPGTIWGIGVAVTTMVIALQRLPDIIPEAVDQWNALKVTIADNFWAAAAGPIKQLVDVLFPQFAAGMAGIATALGTFFGSLSGAMIGVLDGAMNKAFDALAQSIVIASGAMGPLVNSLSILINAGASLLPQMATWFVDASTSMDNWLQAAESDGRLQQWITNASTAFGDLMDIMKSLFGIFSGIGNAAAEAGGSSLSMISDTMKSVSDAVNSPDFQAGLTKFFSTSHQMMSDLAERTGPAVTNMFSTMGDTFSKVGPSMSASLGTAISSIATLLADPALQTGIQAMFGGFSTAMDSIGPMLASMGPALGTLFTTLGTLAAQFAPVLSAVLVPLGDAFTKLMPAILPLVGVLSGALTQALTALKPALDVVVTALVGLLSGGVMDVLSSLFGTLSGVIAQLAPILGQVLATAITAIGPILSALAPIIGMIVQAIGSLLAAVLPKLMPLLSMLGPLIASLVTALQPIIKTILDLAVNVLGVLIGVIINVVSAVLPPFIAACIKVAGALQPFIDVIASVVTWLVSTLAPAVEWIAKALLSSFTGIANGIGNVLKGVFDTIMGVWNFWKSVFTGDWEGAWNAIKQFVSGIWDTIKGAFEILINVGILGVFKKGWALLKAGWEEGWNGIKAFCSLIWDGLKAAWDGFCTTLKEAPGKALSAVKNLFSDAWSVIKSGFSMAIDGWKGILNGGLDFIKSVPGKIKDFFVGAGDLLRDIGSKIIDGLINGFKAKFDAVKNTLGDLTEWVKKNKGPEEYDKVLLVNAGQLIMDGFIRGLESRYDAVRKSLQGFSADLSGMVIESPAVNAMAPKTMMSAVDKAMSGDVTMKVLNYNAAPNQSISSEEDLFDAIGRAGSW